MSWKLRNPSKQVGIVLACGFVPLLVCAAVAGRPLPIQETIPEMVAGGASNRTRSAPSGKSPALVEILASADLVVRGIVGEPRSYLSLDKRDVYTDYLLVAPVVLYQRVPRTAEKPGQLSISVTQLGGKVMVGNAQFTQTELGLPALIPGTNAIFVLHSIDGKYHIARTFYGAFGITDNMVVPLTSKHDFAPEYRDAPVATVLADLAKRLAR